MARMPRDITETERAVLEVLWDRGSATIREITDVVYPAGAHAQFATVQKLLERLEGKECVSCDRTGSVKRFAATLDRDDLLGRRLQAIVEDLCDGSWTPLLTHLARNRKLSAKERQSLRRLVDELDVGSRRKEQP